ncbi:MAG: hypothetical protein H7287_04585, partial [Thermoleophilia bacterium]|nr:hypothetical protein [Thermoleophilia bacterium]
MQPRPNFRRLAVYNVGTLAILMASVFPHAAHAVDPPAAAGPSVGIQLTLAGAAAYPRGAATEWRATIDATESASFRVTTNAVDATINLVSCSTDTGLACSVTSGQVDVVTDGDPTAVEPVIVTVVGMARPSVTVPLSSIEGGPIPVANRALTVRAAPVTGTTGVETTQVLQLPVTTNPDTQSAIEITTLAPAAGATATRGGTVPYRATFTRTGNLAAETAVSVRLLAGTLGVSGTTAPGTALVMIAPGVQSVTVQLSARVPIDAAEGAAQWHLQGTWGVDTEVGLDRSFLVPPAPPVPDPVPDPAPVLEPTSAVAPLASPVVIPMSPAPLAANTAGGPAKPGAPKPAAARDTTPPTVGITLLSPRMAIVHRGDRPRLRLRYACPKSEVS